MSISILVCTNYRADPLQPSCARRGGQEILAALREAAQGLPITVEELRCFGQCPRGPVVRIAPGGDFFYQTGPEQAAEIVAAALACATDG